MDLKARIRKEILEKRYALTEREVKEKSLLIEERLFQLREFREAGLIMFYASFKNEVRTKEMIEKTIAQGKKVALPNTSKQNVIRPYLLQNLNEDLALGCFGIPEPKVREDREVNPEEIDMIIVPGVAFDRKGSRIGFGRGFYDRFLHSILPRPFCVGLGFEIQILESLPVENYDEKVDMVITEKQSYAAEQL